MSEEIEIIDPAEDIEIEGSLTVEYPFSGRRYARWPVFGFQHTQHENYGEGWQWQNGILVKTENLTPAIDVRLDKTKTGRAAGKWLIDNNIHGNKSRFTNSFGDYFLEAATDIQNWFLNSYVDKDANAYTGAGYDTSSECENDWKRSPYYIQDHYFGIEILSDGWTGVSFTYDADFTTYLANAYAELHLLTGGSNWYLMPYWLFLLLTNDDISLALYASEWYRNTATFINTATTNPGDTSEFLYSGREINRAFRAKTTTFNTPSFFWRPMSGF